MGRKKSSAGKGKASKKPKTVARKKKTKAPVIEEDDDESESESESDEEVDSEDDVSAKAKPAPKKPAVDDDDDDSDDEQPAKGLVIVKQCDPEETTDLPHFDLSSSVDKLKSVMEGMEGIPPSAQRLTASGKTLKSGSVSDYISAG